MADLALDKNQIRKIVKSRKSLMSKEFKLDASAKIFQMIDEAALLSSAENIMLYHSLPDEVDTHAALKRLAEYKNVFLPVVVGDDIKVARFRSADDMVIGAYDILEPRSECIVDDSEISKIEVCIIPAVALDRGGVRLGRGKGYYDRFLKGKSFIKIGITYDCQLFDMLPVDPFDINMDYVVTESTFININLQK